MRNWKYFNEEEATKFAKGNLAIQKIPLTEENIKNELDNVYTDWIWLKTNDIMREKKEIDFESEKMAIYYQLKTIPTKYYPIVLQWLYEEPIHYEGKYFNFEDAYNYAKEHNDSFGQLLDFHILIKCICCFTKYENNMETYEHLTNKEIEDFKQALSCQMSRNFFYD